MAKGQKEAVIEQVLFHLPHFVKGQDNAMTMLSHAQLEAIKGQIRNDIHSGLIDYSKDASNLSEVQTYARSMVMNHLKKAKELNGGQSYVPTNTNVSTSTISAPSTLSTPRVKQQKVREAPKGVETSLLTPELKEYAKSLV